MSFVHLHTHTEYSLLDGSNKIKDYVSRVKELGQTAAAITDHGVMYGVVDFYEAAKNEGINPILGCEIYVAPGSRFDKEASGGDDRYNHLILLAENDTGYQNLVKIVSKGFTEGYYYKPRVDHEVLEQYHEGLICLSACLAGEVPRFITRGMIEKAEETARWYKNLFGEGNYFLEMQDHGIPAQRTVNMELMRMSRDLDIPLVATNDCHYTNADDAQAHDVLLCIQTGAHLSDENRMRYEGGQYYVKSEEEMRELFPYALEAVENTAKIAERCHVEIHYSKPLLPVYEIPAEFDSVSYIESLPESRREYIKKGEDSYRKAGEESGNEKTDGTATVDEYIRSWQYLNYLCDEGMRERYPEQYRLSKEGFGDVVPIPELADGNADKSGVDSPLDSMISKAMQDDEIKRKYADDGGISPVWSWNALCKRLEYELDVMRTMDFINYFLIVWDYINYAKEHDIPVGPGRGSAAGSIVSYAIHITDIDPIRYQLLFERFLNPERVSMPDIDVDFCYNHREDVIQYVREKYGNEKVVQIVTFGKLLAKGVIRDVGRVMDLPYAKCDQLAKMVPAELNITLSDALDKNPDLMAEYTADDDVHILIDYALKLEGLPRQTGMHAAGVVICPKAADDMIPLALGGDNAVMAQFTMATLEPVGLLKMDFLGLRTLTVIKDTLNNIKATTGKDIDISKIDYEDPAVYAMLSSGDCVGVFQLESAGMTDFMKTLKPRCLEDVIAGISLYRPGPMDFIPKYLAGKNDPQHIVYECPELEPILKATYGCIVYQEQVMQIVRDLAGFSMGRSDNVRRAMSKKKEHVMEHERNIFIHGNESEIEAAKKKGLPEVDWPAFVPGCVKNGISEEAASRIYATMMDFAKYAFNKSHAACYAVVGYQTAYLKHYYPAEFMAAIMTSVIDNSTKLSEYLMYIRTKGINLLPPDINYGGVGFTVNENGIYYALNAVRGVGGNVVAAVVKERDANGPYRSMRDFIERTSDKGINKRLIENLIKAGAFDCFGVKRKELMYIYPDIMDSVAADRKSSMAGQISLFDLMGEEGRSQRETVIPKDIGEFEREELLQLEKEVLGIYLSGHPLEEYVGLWDSLVTNYTTDLYLEEYENISELKTMNVSDGSRISLAGIVSGIKIKYTKKGDAMAFVTLEDLVGQAEVIVFPKTLTQYRSLLAEDSKVIINGKVSAEEEKDGKLIAERIDSIESVQKTLWIQYKDETERSDKINDIKKILSEHPGEDGLRGYISDQKKVLHPDEGGTEISAQLVSELREVLGNDNVKVTYALPQVKGWRR